MSFYFLAIFLPTDIQDKLAALCYGLPYVRWIEKGNFHLTVRYFGPLSDFKAAEISECLKEFFFAPFPLTLKGLGYLQNKGRRGGTIWIGVEPYSPLIALRKECKRLLRDLYLPSEERPFHPHITLGYDEGLNSERLNDYLVEHSCYQPQCIEVTNCLLLRSLQTPKRIIYEVIEEYPASQLATGED